MKTAQKSRPHPIVTAIGQTWDASVLRTAQWLHSGRAVPQAGTTRRAIDSVARYAGISFEQVALRVIRNKRSGSESTVLTPPEARAWQIKAGPADRQPGMHEGRLPGTAGVNAVPNRSPACDQ